MIVMIVARPHASDSSLARAARWDSFWPPKRFVSDDQPPSALFPASHVWCAPCTAPPFRPVGPWAWQRPFEATVTPAFAEQTKDTKSSVKPHASHCTMFRVCNQALAAEMQMLSFEGRTGKSLGFATALHAPTGLCKESPEGRPSHRLPGPPCCGAPNWYPPGGMPPPN